MVAIPGEKGLRMQAELERAGIDIPGIASKRRQSTHGQRQHFLVSEAEACQRPIACIVIDRPVRNDPQIHSPILTLMVPENAFDSSIQFSGPRHL
jgi:hypothetical protein